MLLSALLAACGGGGGSSSEHLVAPSIGTQPQSQSVADGSTLSRSVSASGSSPLSYQWLRDGVAIAGATSAIYVSDGCVIRKISTGGEVSTLAGAALASPATPTGRGARPVSRTCMA